MIDAAYVLHKEGIHEPLAKIAVAVKTFDLLKSAEELKRARTDAIRLLEFGLKAEGRAENDLTVEEKEDQSDYKNLIDDLLDLMRSIALLDEVNPVRENPCRIAFGWSKSFWKSEWGEASLPSSRDGLEYVSHLYYDNPDRVNQCVEDFADALSRFYQMDASKSTLDIIEIEANQHCSSKERFTPKAKDEFVDLLNIESCSGLNLDYQASRDGTR